MKFPAPFYRWRPHPWHGLEAGDNSPEVVNVFIEMTPFDLVKYEVDKTTGYLRIDRPQRGSSQPPTLYGFMPRTFCGRRVGALNPVVKKGDGDPLDICVLSERAITRAEILLEARVVGGIRMVDHAEADDKIIAVLNKDAVWSAATDISDLPEALIERLQHYFSTYKLVPGKPSEISIEGVYGREDAQHVVEAAVADYEEEFGS